MSEIEIRNTAFALPSAAPSEPPQAALECTCPSSHSTVASGVSPKKHSIDMGSSPVKQHQLEWHVTQFVVGSGTSKKSILNSIGTCVCLSVCVCGGIRKGHVILPRCHACILPLMTPYIPPGADANPLEFISKTDPHT